MNTSDSPLQASFKSRQEAVGKLALLHYPGWQLSSVSSCTLVLGETGDQTVLLWIVTLIQVIGGTKQEIKISHMPIVEREGAFHVITVTSNTVTIPINNTYSARIRATPIQ